MVGIDSKKRDAAVAAVLFLIVFAIYLATSVPAIIFEDTGEFSTGAATLGVSHPPGYVLYTLVGKLFSMLPTSEAAFSVVVFSCLAGAVCCGLLFVCCRVIGFSRAASMCAGLLFGVSQTFWSQCVIPEVYALQLLLTVGLLWSVLVIFRGGGPKVLMWAVGLLALSFLNQYIAFVVFAPLVALCVIVLWRRGEMSWAVLAGCAAIVVLTVCVAIYLPLRSAANPAIYWGDSSTFTGFIAHIKRTQFVFYESQLVFNVDTKLKYMGHFLAGLPEEFTPLFVFAALIGAFLLLADRWKDFLLFAYLLIMHTVAIILFINFHFSPDLLAVFRVFYLGAYLVMAVFAAAGLDGVVARIKDSSVPRAAPMAAAVLVLATAWPFAQNLPGNNWAREQRPLRFGRDIFRTMRRDAVFFIQGAMHLPPVEYLHIAQGLRGDVLVVDGHGTILRKNLEKFGHTYRFMDIPAIEDQITVTQREARPIYSAFARSEEGQGLGMVNLGPVFKVANGGCDLSVWAGAAGDFGARVVTGNYEADMLEAFVLSRQAQCDLERGGNASALEKLKVISRRFPDSPPVDISIASILMQYGRDGEAEAWLNRALAACPTYSEAYTTLGALYTHNGNASKAKKMYELSLTYTPNLYTTLMNLGNLYQTTGEFQSAVDMYRKVIDLRPDAAIAYNNLGNAFAQMHLWNDALRSYNKAIEISPYMTIAYNDLGAFYIARKEYDKAEPVLRKFIELEPHLATGYFNMGFAMQQEGDYNSALDWYGRSVAADPGFVPGWTRIITIYKEQDRTTDALSAVRRMREASYKMSDEAQAGRNMDGVLSVNKIIEMKKKSKLLSQWADKIELKVRESGGVY